MHKGTFELLPGCASIVLERIVAVQSFVIHQSNAKDDEHVMNALRRLYAAVSRLTQWADAVIVNGGSVEWTPLAEADCTKEVCVCVCVCIDRTLYMQATAFSQLRLLIQKERTISQYF